jgi:probable HAF family extracellular repeat protein
VSAIFPRIGVQGKSQRVRLLGSGFDPGTPVQFALGAVASDKVRVDSMPYAAADDLVVYVSVAPDAPPGYYEVLAGKRKKRGIGSETYDVTAKSVDLGTLGGATSEASAVNSGGDVVGVSQTASGARHAFFRAASGAMVDLGTLPGGRFSQATAVNDSGVVVGVATDASSVRHAFEWTAAGGMIDLGPGEALAINNLGQIVGDNGKHAVLWTAPGTAVELSSTGGFSRARGINDLGVIVGSAFVTPTSRFEAALRWRQVNGDWVADTLAPVETYSSALVINARGDVVGVGCPRDPVASNGCLPEGNHAYFWPAGGALTDLGSLGGGRAVATAINAAGEIVGWSNTPYTEANLQRGTLWNAESDVGDLGALEGADLSAANGINDRGWVVGWSLLNDTGARRATLWILR